MTIVTILLLVSAILLAYVLVESVRNEDRRRVKARLHQILATKTSDEMPLTADEIREFHAMRWAGD